MSKNSCAFRNKQYANEYLKQQKIHFMFNLFMQKVLFEISKKLMNKQMIRIDKLCHL